MKQCNLLKPMKPNGQDLPSFFHIHDVFKLFHNVSMSRKYPVNMDT